ncbi:MAG: ArnT family glycosyltransferase [Candidatus Sumerlaeia bacterium]
MDDLSDNSTRRRFEFRILLIFVAVNAIFRLMLINQNGGEYTDGILQLTQFERRDSFWPPLYTALAWLLRAVGIDALFAGRLISWAAAVGVVFPIWRIARRWGGPGTAVGAVAFYTVSPMALRWSVRVMTDMPFLFFFMMSVAAILEMTCTADAGQRSRRLIMATVWAVLAALTRYQGLMLAPVLGLGAVWLLVKGRDWKALAAQALWIAIPAWVLIGGFRHGEQVAARTGSETWQTLLNYWNVLEMFIYIIPYAITIPVFCFFATGLATGPKQDDATKAVPLRWFFLYASICILVAQSLFQSFQTRYLLPLIPFIYICGGAGMARLWEVSRKRRLQALAGGLIALTLLFSTAFMLTSFFLQRGAFADIYNAGYYIQLIKDFPEDGRVFTNETYNADISAVKLSFASDREAESIPDIAALTGLQNKLATIAPMQLLQMDASLNLRLRRDQQERLQMRAPVTLTTPQILALWKSGQLPEASGPALRPTVMVSRDQLMEIWNSGQLDEMRVPAMPTGSILALHSAYGGFENLNFVEQLLASRYSLRPLPDAVFRATLVPLLPDIMQEPGTHQNPMAWFFRYQPQRFETRLYLVGPKR